jgi:hypothetical protein
LSRLLASSPSPSSLRRPAALRALTPPGWSSRRCSPTTPTATTAVATPPSSRTSPLSSSRCGRAPERCWPAPRGRLPVPCRPVHTPLEVPLSSNPHPTPLTPLPPPPHPHTPTPPRPQDFHARYYHPSNGRFWFYGDDDPVKRLEILDGYLGEFTKRAVDSSVATQVRVCVCLGERGSAGGGGGVGRLDGYLGDLTKRAADSSVATQVGAWGRKGRGLCGVGGAVRAVRWCRRREAHSSPGPLPHPCPPHPLPRRAAHPARAAHRDRALRRRRGRGRRGAEGAGRGRGARQTATRLHKLKRRLPRPPPHPSPPRTNPTPPPTPPGLRRPQLGAV